MPPKKAIEVVAAPEAPDQPPTFDSDAFVDSLLLMAKKRELGALEEGVAAAVGMADDFRINLRNGVVVDYTVECVLFASQLNFSARKTSSFVKWMAEIRTCIESTGDVEKAKHIFRNHIITHAEKGTALAASSNAQNAAEETTTDAPAGKGGAKPSAAAAPGGKGAPAGAGAKGAAVPAVKPANENAFDASTILSLNDMGPVADFVVTGVLQHWRLYHHVANSDIASSTAAVHTIAVQTPIAAPALMRALPAEQYEAQQDALRRKADEELLALQREEEERRAEERRERERKEEEARLAAEEAKANTLYFEKHGTDKIIANVHDEIHVELSTKHASVVARLARIEELLHLQGM